MSATIVWFRQDLRLADHLALNAAAARGQPIIPLYILDDETPGPWKRGGAQRWWLHHSLQSLSVSLEQKNLQLILKKGNSLEILQNLIQETRASGLYWHRCYEPFAVERDRKIKEFFTNAKIETKSFNGSLLFEPWTITNQKKEPYRVFSQYWRACLKQGFSQPSVTLNESLIPFPGSVESEDIKDWALLPSAPNWAKDFSRSWQPGEHHAQARLIEFIENGINHYKLVRNRPDCEGTSGLSPHLHFGEISPRQIWDTIYSMAKPSGNVDRFMTEIGWREFSYAMLFHFPYFPETSFRPEFDHFPWQTDQIKMKAWQKGQTGFPIVDAGMRQLWKMGWMHNRVRMIVASFLCKDLHIDWREGEKWFHETLLDADLANNAMGWQWVAGSGVDAAPYFRIFNPVLQSEKFDPQGDYIKQWIPELSKLPFEFIHQPWLAPQDVLQKAGLQLGKDYPYPLVDHKEARRYALAIYKDIKEMKYAVG